MNQKLVSSIFLSSLLIGSSIAFVETDWLRSNQVSSYEDETNEAQNQDVTANVTGAVQNQGQFLVERGTTHEQLIKKLKPQVGIDWKKVDRNAVILKPIKLVVPFLPGQGPRFDWRAGLKEDDLIALNLSTAIENGLRELFKTKKEPTWEDIDAIPGVGEVTLAKLKKEILL